MNLYNLNLQQKLMIIWIVLKPREETVKYVEKNKVMILIVNY